MGSPRRVELASLPFGVAASALGLLAATVLACVCLSRSVAHAQPVPDPRRDALFRAATALFTEATTLRERLRERANAMATSTGRQQVIVEAELHALAARIGPAFDAAAQEYRAFLASYPSDLRSDVVRFRMALALAGARHNEQAARVFAGVAASSESPQRRAQSAYLAVFTHEASIGERARRGELDACTALRAGVSAQELVDDAGRPLLADAQAQSCTSSSERLVIPEWAQTLIDLRREYIARVAPELDGASTLATALDATHGDCPPFRPIFADRNAQTLRSFGHGAEAEAESRSSDRPSGQGVLRREVYNGSTASDPIRALMLRAERAPWGEAMALHEQAADLMEQAVRVSPNHPDAPLGGYYAALFLEQSGRTTRALARYLEVIREYERRASARPPSRCEAPTVERIDVLEAATFRAAVNAQRLFVPDLARRLYRSLVDDARFSALRDHVAHVHEAMAALADLADLEGSHGPAAIVGASEASLPNVAPEPWEAWPARAPAHVWPRPAPSHDQVNALQLLEAEADGFVARGRQFRADIERLAATREELADRQRRTLMVPGPLEPPPLARPIAPLTTGADSPVDATTTLDEAAPGTARYVDALAALAASLARPDPRLDARCRPLVLALVGAPAGRLRARVTCAALLRVVRPDELASMSLPATALPTPWSPVIPGSRAWRPALLLQLAADALRAQRIAEGVALLRVFLAQYPLHRDAPAAADRIVAGLDSLGLADLAESARTDLAEFAAGSPWHSTYDREGALLQSTSALVARHLRQAATSAHERAERARRDASHAPEAIAADELSARLLATCIAADPNGEDADALRLQRAVALAGAAHHEEAAELFEVLAESSQDGSIVARAARGAREQRRAHVIALVARGQLDACSALRAGIDADALADATGGTRPPPTLVALCEAAPGVPGSPVRELPIPAPIGALMRARTMGIIAMSSEGASHEAAAIDGLPTEASPDGAALAAWLALLNARTLLRYGYVQEAEGNLRQMLESGVCGPIVDVAFDARRFILARMGRESEAEFLESERERYRRRCMIARCPDGETGAHRFKVRFAFSEIERAMFSMRDAEIEPSAERRTRLYERAADALDRALRADPNHPEAASAHYYVALILERIGRMLSAEERYARITREFNSTLDSRGHALCGEALLQRINVLELATFRAAVTAERNYEFDVAIARYRSVVDDPRFAAASEHDSHVHDALASIAIIETYRGRWRAAGAAWAAFEPFATPELERAEVRFRHAEIPYREGRWRDAIRSLGAFVHRPATGEEPRFRLLAWSLLAECHRRLSDAAGARAATIEAVRAFHAAGLSSSPMPRSAASAALLREVDARVSELVAHRPSHRAAASVEAWLQRVAALDRDVEEMARQSPVTAIGARVRLGEAYERLATADEATQTAPPGDAALRRDWRALAVAHYLAAVREARRDGMPSPTAERALDRIHASENRAQLPALIMRGETTIERSERLDWNPPGALLLEWGGVATPALVGPDREGDDAAR